MGKIGLGGWSLHRRFQSGELSLLDYPRFVTSEFGLNLIEFNSPFFESREGDYLDRLRAAVEGAGCAVCNIAVDGEGDLSAADDAARRQSVAGHAVWLDIAKEVGSPTIRVNTGGRDVPPDEAAPHCTQGLKELCAEAEKRGVKVLIENHGGLSSDPDVLLRVIEEVGSEALGTLPDFGNFEESIRYEGVRKLAPKAFCVHAKMYEFDDAGRETTIDVPRMADILREAGYAGPLLLEYEGPGDELDGVRKGISLLRKVWAD